jgi:SAM-dependent methyltransferase
MMFAGLRLQPQRVTRGHGVLEGLLARLRGRQARRLMPPSLPRNRILDVGCGSYPLFLLSTQFTDRYGLDRDVPAGIAETQNLHLVAHDVEHNRKLPFDDAFFDAVTMLAVFEHLDEPVLIDLLREIRRVLVPGGVFVMTTPADWTAGILTRMAKLWLVSSEEVGEHKSQYSQAQIRDLLTRAGFAPERVDAGSFEAGMNLWARAAR